MRRVPHVRVWSDYYRFPIKMVFAVCLLKNAILVLSRVGHLHPIIKPHRGAFVVFPKQNVKCPKNARRGMCTLGIDWAIFLCLAFARSSRAKQIRRSNSDRAAGVEKTRLIKHSMVTDTKARRIITVSNIDQVIFFLIMLTHCFFPATIQLAKCNVRMTRDTIDLAKPLSNKILCSTPGCDTKVVSSCASFNPLDI